MFILTLLYDVSLDYWVTFIGGALLSAALFFLHARFSALGERLAQVVYYLVVVKEVYLFGLRVVSMGCVRLDTRSFVLG